MDVFTKRIDKHYKTDVVVIGSGSSGAVAAITTALEGAKALLVERYGFMGGISTQALETFYGFYTPGEVPKKVVGGVPDMVVDELMRRETALLRPNAYGAGQGITYDPDTLKVVWETLAQDVGVNILYHTLVVNTLMDDERITGVIAVGKGGFISIETGIVIDASGDADIAAAAGVPYESAEDGPVQSLTTTFRLLNVDVKRARRAKNDKLHALMADAIEQGYALPQRERSVHITLVGGVMATNMTRVGEVDATNPEQLTPAEVAGRKQAMEYARFLTDMVAGYENAILAGFSNQIGVRESRRIFGEYRLTRDDVISARRFDDGIVQCGAPIEDHHAGIDTEWEFLPEGSTYHIPYRSLVPQVVDNLLIVGRCLSAEHDAHASGRSMGQCIAMGQAAGTAAAIALETKLTPRAVPIDSLQERPRTRGVLLE